MKQFWITLREDGEPTHIALFEPLTDRPQLHVIEYSEYIKYRNMYEAAGVTCKVIYEELEQERQRNEKLVKALKKIHKFSEDNYIDGIIEEYVDETIAENSKESK